MAVRARSQAGKKKKTKGEKEHRGAATKTLVGGVTRIPAPARMRPGALQNYGHRKATAGRCERLREKTGLYLPKELARLKGLKIDFSLTNKNEKRITSCSAKQVTRIATA